jgi:MFS family permease
MRTPAVVASSAVGLVCGWNITNIGAIAGRVATSYKVDLTEVGLFTMVLVATHTIAQIPGGRIVDRYGARRLAGGSMVFIMVCNAALLAAPEPALAFPLRAAIGLGTGAGFVAGSALIRSAGGLALAQGFYGGIGIGAGGFALAVVPQVETLVGWRAPYLTAGVAALAGLLLVATTQR